VGVVAVTQLAQKAARSLRRSAQTGRGWSARRRRGCAPPGRPG
jgi:hypothetical protein